MSAPVLVVGVGSELRSDDAAGRRVVDRLVGELPPTSVEIRSVHQLVPELAADAVGRRLVIVVDASVDVEEVTIREVAAAPSAGAMTHHLDVAALIGLSTMLGAPPMRVVTVAVPARSLELGTTLSPATAQDVDAAAGLVLELCRGHRDGPVSGRPGRAAGA